MLQLSEREEGRKGGRQGGREGGRKEGRKEVTGFITKAIPICPRPLSLRASIAVSALFILVCLTHTTISLSPEDDTGDREVHRWTQYVQWLAAQATTWVCLPSWFCHLPAVWPGLMLYNLLWLSFVSCRLGTITGSPPWVAVRTEWVSGCQVPGTEKVLTKWECQG